MTVTVWWIGEAIPTCSTVEEGGVDARREQRGFISTPEPPPAPETCLDTPDRLACTRLEKEAAVQRRVTPRRAPPWQEGQEEYQRPSLVEYPDGLPENLPLVQHKVRGAHNVGSASTQGAALHTPGSVRSDTHKCPRKLGKTSTPPRRILHHFLVRSFFAGDRQMRLTDCCARFPWRCIHTVF